MQICPQFKGESTPAYPNNQRESIGGINTEMLKIFSAVDDIWVGSNLVN